MHRKAINNREAHLGIIHTENLTFSLRVFENTKSAVIYMQIQEEYLRIKALFAGVDEKQLELIDGAILECARLRVQLNDLNEIAKESGLIKVHPENKKLQKELTVSKLIVKVRANYLNYITKLSNMLGRNIDDDEDDLEEFE